MHTHRKTRQSRIFLLSGLALLIIGTIFLTAPAQAGAPCFTDVAGQWYEPFVCWLKARGISSGYPDGTFRPNNNITRAEVATLLNKSFTAGGIQINTGPQNWVANGIQAGVARPVEAYTQFGSTATGLIMYYLSPSIPSSLYGSAMELKGIKICYDATTAGAYLDALRIQHLRYTGGVVSLVNDYWDYTDVAIKACAAHYFATPVAMTANDQVIVTAILNFTDTNATLMMGGVTFYLDPSDTVLAVP